MDALDDQIGRRAARAAPSGSHRGVVTDPGIAGGGIAPGGGRPGRRLEPALNRSIATNSSTARWGPDRRNWDFSRPLPSIVGAWSPTTVVDKPWTDSMGPLPDGRT